MDEERNRWIERKASVVVVVLGLAFVALILRLGTLQLVQGRHYASLAFGQRIRLLQVAAPRGEILDSQGQVLAVDHPSATAELVYTANPLSTKEVALLAKILAIPTAVIKKADHQRRNQPAYEPVRLKTNLSAAEHTLLEEDRAQLPGVVVTEEPMRDYPGLPGVANPGAELASHVLGFVKIGANPLDVTGADGIEASYNGPLTVGGKKILGLAGVDGSEEVEVDARGRPQKVLAEKPPVAGNNVVLTLNGNLEAVAQRVLTNWMQQLRTRNDFGWPDPGPFPTANSGGVVAVDPNTGAILALVSVPAFNPNDFAQAAHVLPGTPAWQRWQQQWAKLNSPKTPGLPLINHAISDLFPPGSTFKPLTALAALKAGVITPSEKIPCPGTYQVAPGYYKHDWVPGGQGILNLYQAIGVSCDTYFYKVGAETGIKNIDAMAAQFFLGQPTGQHALAGEQPGQVASPAVKARIFPHQPWYPSETMDASIGQGYTSLNLLEWAEYVAALANGGTVYRPYFVKEVTSPSGQVLAHFGPTVRGHVDASAADFQAIRRAMASTTQYNPGWTQQGVYSDYGTAAYMFTSFYAAQKKVLGHTIPIAAKTGTSQVTGINSGEFICFAPVQHPVIAIAVYVDHGGGGAVSGATTCEAMVNAYMGVPKQPPAPGTARASSPVVTAKAVAGSRPTTP